MASFLPPRSDADLQPSLRVTAFRAVFFCIALCALNQNIGADLAAPAIFFAGLLGAYFGARAALSHLAGRGFAVLLGGSVVSWLGLRYLGDQFNPGSGAFDWYTVSRAFELYLGIFSLLSVCEWLYRRTAAWLTVEATAIGAVAMYALSPHRQFRLDSPRAIAEIAWNWNSNPIAVFIVVGALLAAVIVLFTAVCAKPRARMAEPMRRKAVIVSAGSFAALIVLVSFVAFHFTTVAAGSRLMNGVGQNDQEGVSPLSFQSALGATNQPSAVVRLEGDYKENPHSPMLYLREDALSEYNGTELVHSGGAYDRDVIKTPPTQVFKAEEDASLLERMPLPHSVYLLAEHKIPFAIDFPISLIPLKNPNPGKFKGGAYRVYSQVPVYQLRDLHDGHVGNPDWDEVERQHYLKANPDPRYTDLAVEITTGVTNEVERAFALSNYLSEKSIYTLAPNHDVATGDLTAPYLFGDFRGYCVHFAHAMVYMLRSIGIPSRIGTGYLTDLSQSKDGHILLRMSDRHAWAEVYVSGKGWVPFDVQPEQVESHGDSEVDQKLLEDLMAQLDPGEEILPKEPSKPEPGLHHDTPTQWSEYLPDRTIVLLIIGVVCGGIICLKQFLKHLAWRLPLSAPQRVVLGYRAQVLNAAELGVARRPSETRAEFERRAQEFLRANPVGLTSDLNTLRFGAPEHRAKIIAPRSLSFLAPRSPLARLWQLVSPTGLRRYFSP